MWLFTTIGFFSVTQSDKPGTLQIRARVREDLDNLRAKYLPNLGETIQLPGRDYPYRAYASHEEVSQAMGQMVLDINFSNFKSEVIKTQGLPRELLYAKVWSVMYNAETKLEDEARALERKHSKVFSTRNTDLDDIFDRYSPSTQQAQFEGLTTNGPKVRQPAPRPKRRNKR
jgi:hypothetical protein